MQGHGALVVAQVQVGALLDEQLGNRCVAVVRSQVQAGVAESGRVVWIGAGRQQRPHRIRVPVLNDSSNE